MGSTDEAFELADFAVRLIGCGNMGTALAKGAVSSGVLEPGQLVCCDRKRDRAEALAENLGATAAAVDDIYDYPGDRSRRLFVLAVKPKDLEEALEAGRGAFAEADQVLSIAAGVSTESIRDWAGPTPGIVRAMPNTPALVGRGMTGVYTPDDLELVPVLDLFEGVGRSVALESETDFDGLTAVSGSGPAYVFTIIEALADGAVREGLDRDTAIELAVETLLGSAKLVRERDAHTAELKDAVTSPGGTTAEGLATLERNGLRGVLVDAVRAAADKSRSMEEN